MENQTTNWLSLAEPEWTQQIPYGFSKRHRILVIKEEDGCLIVLHTSSVRAETIEEVERHFLLPIKGYQLHDDDFNSVHRGVYDKGQSAATQMVEDMDAEVDFAMLARELPQTMDLLDVVDDAPIIRLINALLTQAIREEASDIHLEAFEARSMVRFRVDGLLRDVIEPQRVLHNALVSRLKVMAKLDIAEKRLPQDGRMSVKVGDRQMDVRMSVLPTQYGERIVMRLLDKQFSRFPLQGLGMDDDLLREFSQLTRCAHGILLVTGPTGSGKTTSLYAGISALDRETLNILTIEDPVEYDLSGIGQTQVNNKINFSFAAGFRSILRQDPDVVLIGEIRDLETAEIAVQASLTGHLVLSTLHTNSAIDAVGRLVNMGVEPYLLASSLIGVLAQRLVRKLCQHCGGAGVYSAGAYSGRAEIVGDIDHEGMVSVHQRASVGCDQCSHTGYKGRTGIYELIVMDDRLRTLIHEQRSQEEMLIHVRKTTTGIYDYGLRLVNQGITSVEELSRVASQ